MKFYKGKTVWIIGGTSGIGLSMAKQLINTCKVIVSGRDTLKINDFTSPNLTKIPLDVTNSRGFSEAANSILENFQKADIILFCAGTYEPMSLKSFDAKHAQKILETNLTSMVNFIDIIPYFFENPKYIESCTGKILKEITKFKDKSKSMVILFSAHGIPKDFVQKWNDPYEQQINKTAFLITQNLKKEGIIFEEKVCFQSRVGPKEWLKPYIQTIIPEYTGYNMIVFPIAFVSEHLETLVELDHQYKNLANKCNVYEYRRAGTPSECPLFIKCLQEEILRKS